MLRRAYALGCNFFDTADSYGPHVDEELIAEALHPYPKDLVIATKGGLVRPSAPRWDEDGRPEHLRQAIEGSLKRLKVERIDLYQLHAPDPKVPLEDSLGPIVDAQKAGKIRHIGVSNFDVKELERARKVAKIVSVQNQYNVGDRSSEPVLKACERLGIAFLPWYPLGAGSALKNKQLEFHLQKNQRYPGADRPCLAAGEVTGHAAHPRHRLARPPRGEREGGLARARRRRLRFARLAA